jgi:hypothetical protein
MDDQGRLSGEPDKGNTADQETRLAPIFPRTDGLVQPVVAVSTHRSVRSLVHESPHQSDWLAGVDGPLQSGVEGMVPRLIQRLRRRPQILRILFRACRELSVRQISMRKAGWTHRRARDRQPPRTSGGRPGLPAQRAACRQLICPVLKIVTERFAYRHRRRSLHDGERRVKTGRKRARGWNGKAYLPKHRCSRRPCRYLPICR